jgi:hypothetical protein
MPLLPGLRPRRSDVTYGDGPEAKKGLQRECSGGRAWIWRSGKGDGRPLTGCHAASGARAHDFRLVPADRRAKALPHPPWIELHLAAT